MKILFYNIAHCRNCDGSIKKYISQPWKYIFPLQKCKLAISKFIKQQRADVVCLVEADKKHFSYFKKENKFKHEFCGSRYGKFSIFKILPICRKHIFSIFLHARLKNCKTHFLKKGFKKAVPIIELKNGLNLIMVHLALLYSVRKKQLKELAKIVNQIKTPVVLCGDFNIMRGEKELKTFLEETSMCLANQQPTFPSCKPKRSLDLFLVSKNINVKKVKVFEKMKYSDHLPIMMEIDYV